MRLLCIISFILILSTTPLRATDEGAGDSGAFMTIGVGARATALGGAFVSIADDPSANYFNPAGISFIQPRLSIIMMGVKPDEKSSDPTANGIAGHHNYFSGTLKVPRINRVILKKILPMNLGFSYNRFSIGGIEFTKKINDYEFEVIGSGKDVEQDFTASIAKAFSPWTTEEWVGFGGSIRRITQQFFGFEGTAYRVDFGSLIQIGQLTIKNHTLFDRIRLGGSVFYNSERNWEDASDRDSFADAYPPEKDPWLSGFQWGISADKDFNPVQFTVALALINRKKGSPPESAGGLEIWLFKRTIALRAGFENKRLAKRRSHVEEKYRLTFGGGMRLKQRSQIDYSLSNEQLAIKHRVSLTINL